MSKRLVVVLVSCLALLVTCSAASALLRGALLVASYSFANETIVGYGAQLEIPVLPLVDTNLEVILCPGRSGGVDYTFIPVSINVKRSIPLTPCYFGGGIGSAIFNASGVTVPAAFTYNVFVGGEKDLAPLVKGFAQAGYESVNFTTTAGTFPLSTSSLSGFSAKVGVSAGL